MCSNVAFQSYATKTATVTPAVQLDYSVTSTVYPSLHNFIYLKKRINSTTTLMILTRQYINQLANVKLTVAGKK